MHPDADGNKVWTVYRAHTGMKYHGRLLQIEARDSDTAIKKLTEHVERNVGALRAFDPDEILLLKTPDADVVHVVKVNTSVRIDRVARVA